MSILKVNNIELATSGSNNVTFNDNVTFDAAVNISSGSITASFAIANASIEKEKLTNDARDWVNILNKPAGLVTSSAQFATAISGSSLALADITSSGTIKTTGVFSGSGAQLFGIPNAALNNSEITINGTSVSLGGSRTLTTSDISEGTNQYYTDARVKAKMDTETVVSSSGQINYQSVTGKPTVNTLGSDGNKSFTISTGVFVTASGGADGIIVTNDTANYTLRFRTVGGTISSSAQVQAGLPANVVSSSTQVQPLLPGGTLSSSAQYPGWVTASSQIDYNSITNKLSGVISSSAQVQPLLPADTVSSSTQVKAFLPGGTLSSSAQYPGWITSSTQVVQSLPIGTVSSSAQYPGWVTASSQIDVRNTVGIATIATTGSNVFVGNQTMSGSVTVTGNLNVLGSSSILYTTASELIVGDNKIVVNSTDALRFAGLQIIDSGSVSPATASLYWDSLDHHFIYENISGSSYNSSIILAGPKHVGTLGDEPVLTTGRVPVATGEDHLDNRVQSSSIRVDFATLRTDIEAGLFITGSTTASGHIVPSTTDIYDLGSPTLKFRSLYLSGSTLYLGTLALSDNGGALSVSPSGAAAGTNSPVSGAFTGSFKGNGNQLTNIANSALPGGIISSSTQLPAGTVSSSAQYPGWVTASSQVDYNSITNKLSGVYSSSTQVANNLPAGTVSSSGQINAGATANFATAVAAQLGTVHSGSFMSTATTNNLPEGVTNLYYTDARVKTKLSAEVVHSGSFLGTATTDNLPQGATNKYFANSLVLDYINSLSVLSSSQQVVDRLPTGTVSSSNQIANVQVTSASYALTASLAIGVSGSLAVSTDGLNEGTINLYYTDARVKTKLNAENVHSSSYLGTATTTNLTEGINLYFTNQRAKDALPGVVSSSTQVSTLVPAGTVSSSGQVNVRNTTGIATIATTGSNLFIGSQSIVGEYLSSAPTTSSIPNLRLSNGNAVSTWFGGNGYTYNWMQAIQDDGTNNLKNFVLQPLGGSVGIGTYPSFAFEVLGNATRLLGTSASAANVILQSDQGNGAAFWISAKTNSSLHIGGNGPTEPTLGAITILDSGLIGIGTASPTNLLHISGGNIFVDNTNGSVVVRNADVTNQQQIRLRMSGNDGILDVTRNSGTAPNLIFGTEGVEKMRLNANGRLGIGTTSPAGALHINGGDFVRSNTDYDAISTGSGFIITPGASSGNTYTQIYAFSNGNTAYNNLVIPGGNLGIGTTSPAAKLDVRGSVYTTNTYWGYPTELVGNLGRGGSGLADLQIVQAGGAFRVINSAYNSSLFVVNDGGTFYSSGSATIATNIGTGDAYLDIGQGRNASGYAYVDLVGDTTYTDYGLRLIRNNTGANATSFLSHRGTGELGIFTHEAAPITFYTSGSERVRIDASGNLGIGTTSPAYPLHVERASYGMTGYFFTNDGTRNPRLAIYGSSSGTTIQHTYSTGADALMFAVGGAIGSGTEVMRLDANGRVGIGTASPSSLLHLKASTNPVIQFEGASDSGYVDFNGTRLQLHGGGGSMYFVTGNSEKMRLDASGNLGIGTANPSTKLQVDGSIFASSSAATIRVEKTAHAAGTSDFHAELYSPEGSTTGEVSLRFHQSNRYYSQIRVRTGGAFRFTEGASDNLVDIYANNMYASGNLGIGTTSPQAKLDVSGSIFPNVDNSFNLGSPTKRWANVYTGDLVLSNEGSSGNNVDGTTGNWTIQEGEEHLYIINNKSGKKYRFMLTEIN